MDSFDDDIKVWEWNWVNSVNGGYSPVPVGNSFVIAGELFAKYYSKIRMTAYIKMSCVKGNQENNDHRQNDSHSINHDDSWEIIA